VGEQRAAVGLVGGEDPVVVGRAEPVGRGRVGVDGDDLPGRAGAPPRVVERGTGRRRAVVADDDDRRLWAPPASPEVNGSRGLVPMSPSGASAGSAPSGFVDALG